MNINEIIAKLSEPSDVIGLGPSSLASLAIIENPEKINITIAIPDTLLRLVSLISNGSEAHRAYLAGIIKYYRGRPFEGAINASEMQEVEQIVKVVLTLKERERFLILDENLIDPEIQAALQELHPHPWLEISLSPKSNFLRDYIVRVYSWSKRVGGKVIECGDKLYRRVGRYISTLQLPDKLDQKVDLKGRYVKRLFGFRGGKATRYFVGVVVGAAGLAYPPAGIAGLVIAFVDP